MLPKFRYSVRALLAFTAIVAVFVAREASRVRRQQKAVHAIVALGGHVIYSWERANSRGEPLDSGFVRRLIGQDVFSDVDAVDLSMCSDATDDTLAEVAELDGLRRLYLGATSVTGSGFGYLKKLGQLEELDLSGTKVTDANIKAIADLKGLKFLGLYDTQLTDTGLGNLHGLSGLRELALGDIKQFSEAALAELHASLPDCYIEEL